MEYRKLGSSGMYISELAYGNWVTHGEQIDQDEATACVRQALRLRFGLLDGGPRRVDAGGGRDRPDLIMGNVASSHRQNSEDRDAGYPEAGCGDDGKMMAAAAG
jgi:hypothetical protein